MLSNQAQSATPAPTSRLEGAVQGVHLEVGSLEDTLLDLEKKLVRVLDPADTQQGGSGGGTASPDGSLAAELNGASMRINILYHRTQNIIDRLHV